MTEQEPFSWKDVTMSLEEIKEAKARIRKDYPRTCVPDFKKMSINEVLEFFLGLEFEDPLGHPLHRNMYFIELVLLATPMAGTAE